MAKKKSAKRKPQKAPNSAKSGKKSANSAKSKFEAVVEKVLPKKADWKQAWNDPGTADAHVILGIMRDRAFLVAHTPDDILAKMSKGFSQRSVDAYGLVLKLLDPNVKRFEFKTEIRFATAEDAEAARKETEGK